MKKFLMIAGVVAFAALSTGCGGSEEAKYPERDDPDTPHQDERYIRDLTQEEIDEIEERRNEAR